MHDATLGFDPSNPSWKSPSHVPREVICHNDFAPYNLVFESEQLVGVIDFDNASPGPRIWDFAYLAYRLIPFAAEGLNEAPSPAARTARLNRAIESYGGSFDVNDVMGVMVERLEELASYTDSRATLTDGAKFREHSGMYRRDIERLVRRWIRPGEFDV